MEGPILERRFPALSVFGRLKIGAVYVPVVQKIRMKSAVIFPLPILFSVSLNFVLAGLGSKGKEER